MTAMFHADLCLRARARNIARDLSLADPAERLELLRQILIVNGATLTEPRPHDTSDPKRAELALLGISASGDTLHDCLDAWMQAARRCAPIPDTLPDDFPGTETRPL